MSLHPIFSSFVLAKGWGLAYLPPKGKVPFSSPFAYAFLHFFPTPPPYSLAGRVSANSQLVKWPLRSLRITGALGVLSAKG
jgi:hypothetical protein